MDKIYDKAWKLLASYDRWTQGQYARDKDGGNCVSCSQRAVKWCVLGAVMRVYPRDYDKIILAINAKVADGIWGIVHWNDSPERKHSEVVEALKDLDV